LIQLRSTSTKSTSVSRESATRWRSGLAHGRVKWFHWTGSDETIFFFQEVTLVACEAGPKQTPVSIAGNDQQRRI
jgi:hypothetical protein